MISRNMSWLTDIDGEKRHTNKSINNNARETLIKLQACDKTKSVGVQRWEVLHGFYLEALIIIRGVES